MGPAPINPRQRFDEKVDVRGPNDCWEWLARKTHQGYGRFNLRGVNCQANRVAWELEFGAIPEGMHVLHRCDNPSCVNPSHLWLGTNADNVADRVRKGRNPRMDGERNPRQKLSFADVLKIRERFRSGEPSKRLASEYGIARGYVPQLARGVTWGSRLGR